MFCKKDLLLQNLKHLYKESEMFLIDIEKQENARTPVEYAVRNRQQGEEKIQTWR